jgi:integrase
MTPSNCRTNGVCCSSGICGIKICGFILNRHTMVSPFCPAIFVCYQNLLRCYRIFANSDRLCPRRYSTIPLVIPVILRILYSCGLRISEAVSLQNKNVDMEKGVLEIKNSKFGKDRLVPMSQSMVNICRQYYRVLHKHSSIDDYFFMKADREPVTRNNVYRRFREILWESGISHGGKGNGPRLHDLRHTCQRRRQDVLNSAD